jgi:hypothetical protein
MWALPPLSFEQGRCEFIKVFLKSNPNFNRLDSWVARFHPVRGKRRRKSRKI